MRDIASVSRRTFVHHGTTLAASAVLLPNWLRGNGGFDRADAHLRQEMLTAADPALIKRIALAAIDAAKSAGATYADVRLIRTVDQTVSMEGDRQSPTFCQPHAEETELHGIGLRVLVNGMWGFAASPYWTLGEAARLAVDAAAQARENAHVMTARVDLAPAPVATGTWSTPHEVDPFSISLEEKAALLRDALYVTPYAAIDHTREGYVPPLGPLQSRRVERTVATTDGTYVTQQYYEVTFSTTAWVRPTDWSVRDGALWWGSGPRRQPGPWLIRRFGGIGWESVRSLPTLVEQTVDTAVADFFASPGSEPAHKSVELGRYPIVADAASMGGLLAVTLRALDLDRVLGDEVNAGGSSWVGPDPLAALGQFQFGSPLLSVSGERGLVGGPAQTKWDDEGVESTSFPLIQQGIVQGFPTTRALAGLLGPASQRLGHSLQSNGCAMSASAFDKPYSGMPDLVMTPGKDNLGFSELVSSVSRGYALVGLDPRRIETDMQLRQIAVAPVLREIVNGRLGSYALGGTLLFDAQELWKNLTAIGGAESAERWTGSEGPLNVISYDKGEPPQTLRYAAQAVPGMFTNLAITSGRGR